MEISDAKNCFIVYSIPDGLHYGVGRCRNYPCERGGGSLRGVGRKSFRPKEKGIVQKITVPEEQCKDLMHLIADGNSSWIRLLPGETVEVNVGNTPWKFAGDEKKINAYLYDWTQKFWLEKPNSLTMIVQVMFSEIPSEKKKRPAVTDLYQPEYRDWIEHWEKRALADLEKTKLKDEKFVAEQRERIHYKPIRRNIR